MVVKLYSTNCPKCKILEKKLDAANIEYTLVDNIDEVVKFGEDNSIQSAPFMLVDGEVMDFVKANKYLNTL